MRDEFERAVLDCLAEIQVRQATTNVKLDSFAAMQAKHEASDSEHFASVNRRLDRQDEQLEKLADADTSQRIEALGHARTQLATHDSRAWSWKQSLVMAAVSVLCATATALLIRSFGGG